MVRIICIFNPNRLLNRHVFTGKKVFVNRCNAQEYAVILLKKMNATSTSENANLTSPIFKRRLPLSLALSVVSFFSQYLHLYVRRAALVLFESDGEAERGIRCAMMLSGHLH